MKDAARRAIEAKRESLIGLSHRIHAKPELGFQEVESSQWVADAVAEAGYEVTKPAYDLETAFIGRAGSGALHLVICAEYDALPQVGHACGMRSSRLQWWQHSRRSGRCRTMNAEQRVQLLIQPHASQHSTGA